MKTKIPILAGALLALTLLACNFLAQPLDALFPGLFSTLTPLATSTPRATNTPTFTPTPSPSPTPTVTPSPRPTPLQTGMVMRDVIYCSPDGQPQTMDIFFPTSGYGPWPAIINIHGGAWVAGSKLLIEEETDITPFVQAGFIAVSVNYRLAPQFPFPAMIEDLKCSVRFLRAHAAQLNLDVNHIGVRGGSAGGHLAALMGTSDASAGWDTGEYLEYSSRVQAVVAINGPSNLADPSFYNPMGDVAKELFHETSPSSALLVAASSTTYVTPDDPPFLIIYGEKDRVIDPKQSQMLYDALVAAGVPAQIVMVQNANHMLRPVVHAEYTIPSAEQITAMIVAFFEQYLISPQ
ncbi:MAG: alpha/beta hydrolase [Chloroflexota bacterium]